MATLVIWENNMSGRKGTHRTWAGHAALCITDNWAGNGLNKFDDYVSWWPDVEKPGTHPAKPKKTVVDDIKREGYAPDWIIRLGGNVKTKDMVAKWQVERGKHTGDGLRDKSYRFLIKNCSTMVARIMIAGGLTPRTNYRVWTPVRVKDFALAAGGNPMTWDAMKDEMRASGLSDADRKNAHGTIIDCARDKGFCNSGAQPMFSRGGRCGAWTNSAGESVIFEPLDINEN